MNVGMMNGILLNFKKTTFPKRLLFGLYKFKKTTFPKRLLFGLYEKILYQIIMVIFELQVGIFSIII